MAKALGLVNAILDKHGPGSQSGAADDLDEDLGGQQMDLKMLLKSLGVKVGDSPNWSKAVDCFNSFVSKMPSADDEAGETTDEDHDYA